jgi:hypothetical protein
MIVCNMADNYVMTHTDLNIYCIIIFAILSKKTVTLALIFLKTPYFLNYDGQVCIEPSSPKFGYCIRLCTWFCDVFFENM